MISGPLGGVLLTLLPVAVFVVLFRSALRDPVLREAAVAGGVAGALSIYPIKYIIYPMLQIALGADLRSLIADSEDFWMRFCVAVILVGCLEESAKIGAALAGAGWMGALRRSTAVFIAALAAGLGFAIMESLDYISLFGTDVLFARISLSTTGHVLFSGVAGWTAAVALCRQQEDGERAVTWRGYGLFLAGLLVSAVLHGGFNMIAMRSEASTTVPMLAAMLMIGISFLREGWMRILVLDRAESGCDASCHACGALPLDSRGRFCARCGARRLIR